ncbi:maleylpyruvate isomerase family mycothiol-dependent enzyme [Pseudonocardia acaciae]|uniref:maleylpyruvate isomerase family mycothiol-dependent enzyme n=1 Tax=Pseudonocardia acaciae TaxID=551276 RepID=UPI000491305C|nr:maleylpyruvate isomerase family mycothiol-dependent enzyme [Pseudonocardia acaciae]
MAVRRLVADERTDLVAFLRTLSDDDWEAPSLCAGWRVRDVVAHLLYDAVPVSSYLLVAARCRAADRINEHWVDRARSLPPSTLVDRLESSVGKGLFAAVAPSIALADALVHHQDIRRPLGRERTIPPERMLAVLDRPDPFARPGPRARGLRFVATDVPWTRGDGPEVRGTGEAIALAVAGREAVLDELAGDGVAVLRGRR